MEEFKFKGKLNGVEYTDPEKFIKDLKNATSEGNVKEIIYEYSTRKDTLEDSDKTFDDSKRPEKKDYCERTLNSVNRVKEIIEEVAAISEDIHDTDDFDSEKLSTVSDVLKSSIEKIQYIICGMKADDREEFRLKLLKAMRELFAEADSESKDFQYEEAKYRQELVDDNKSIERQIDDLSEAYESNCRDLEFSRNRCDASEMLVSFFSDLLNILEQE